MSTSFQGATVTVEGLRKVYVDPANGMTGGIQEASFDLPRGSFFTLLGPSGCGKTTTLRSIAGLEHPDAGRIQVGEQTFVDHARRVFLPANQRRIGMVFQSYAIWPHMDVADNVAFPLTVAKDRAFSAAERKQLVGSALERVGLAGMQSRPATRLSGGQQQRVAFARAIVRNPSLLLLDEPLSNLDATLRDEMRNELKRLQRDIGITTIYVTHDQAEALEMSDQVAVINQGRIVQIDTPRNIYAMPRNLFVARFVGQTNVVSGVAAASVAPGEFGRIDIGNGHDIVAAFPERCEAGSKVCVSIRPESVTVRAAPSATPSAVKPGANWLPGRVTQCGFLGHALRYRVAVGAYEFQVSSSPKSVVEVGAPAGLEFAHEDAVALQE
jgi:iron(III) transport system ATP-binding protein